MIFAGSQKSQNWLQTGLKVNHPCSFTTPEIGFFRFLRSSTFRKVPEPHPEASGIRSERMRGRFVSFTEQFLDLSLIPDGWQFGVVIRRNGAAIHRQPPEFILRGASFAGMLTCRKKCTIDSSDKNYNRQSNKSEAFSSSFRDCMSAEECANNFSFKKS